VADIDTHVTLSRRALARVLFGLFGLACHDRNAPDTELPTAQVGPHFRKLRKRIRKYVPEHERRAAIALVERTQQQLVGIDRLLVEWRTDLAMLPDDQRWDRTVILQVTRSYSEQLGEVAREVGRLAFQLRCHIDADEWPLVFPSSDARDEHEGPC
jgi:hypothetical protein